MVGELLEYLNFILATTDVGFLNNHRNQDVEFHSLIEICFSFFKSPQS